MGMNVSPDLWVGPDSGPTRDELVSVIYTCEGVPVFAYYVSSVFAKEHALVDGIIPLPDDFHDLGPWEHQMRCCCDKCFRRAYAGHFDEMFRWCADTAVSE
jgi:hypothetical protein